MLIILLVISLKIFMCIFVLEDFKNSIIMFFRLVDRLLFGMVSWYCSYDFVYIGLGNDLKLFGVVFLLIGKVIFFRE